MFAFVLGLFLFIYWTTASIAIPALGDTGLTLVP